MLKEMNQLLFVVGIGIILSAHFFSSPTPPLEEEKPEIEEEMSFFSTDFLVWVLLLPLELVGLAEYIAGGFYSFSVVLFLSQFPFSFFFLPSLPSLSLTSSCFTLLISSLLYSCDHPFLATIVLITSISLFSLTSFLLLFSLSTTLFALIFSFFRFLFLSSLSLLLRIPLLRSLLLSTISFIFFFWFFSLILFEKLLRSLLTYFTSSLSLAGVPFSLVNAPDPTFHTFPSPPCPLPSSSSPSSSSPLPLYHNTLSLANIAKLSYEKSKIVEEIGEKQWGFKKVKAIKFKTTSAFLFCSEDVVVVAFRGTSPLNLGQIVTDIKVHMQPHPPLGLVHWGFLDALFNLPPPASLQSSSSPLQSLEELLPRDSYVARGVLGASRWVGRIVERGAEWARGVTGIQEEGRKYHRTHSSDLLSCFDQVCQAIKDIIEEEEGEGEREGDGEGERTRERKKKNIFVTGHSLGGALASLFVAKGLSEGIFEEEKTEGNTGGEEGRGVERRRKSGGRGLGKLGGLYTFGAPKVGNGEFGELFEGISERVFRIVLRYDIVPHVPTTNMAQTADHIARWLQSSVDPNIILDDCQQHQHHHNQLCYMHPPSEFLFLSRGVLLTNPSLFEMVKAQMTGFFDRKLFQELKNESSMRRVFRLFLPFFLNDHLPGDYVKHLSVVYANEKGKQC